MHNIPRNDQGSAPPLDERRTVDLMAALIASLDRRAVYVPDPDGEPVPGFNGLRDKRIGGAA